MKTALKYEKAPKGAITKEKPKKAKAKVKVTKPKSKIHVKKCVHTFKCLFNDDCESLAKEELLQMTPDQLEYIGRRHGVELDKRLKQQALADELYDVL